MKVALYARVATPCQGNEGGIALQIEALCAHANKQGFSVGPTTRHNRQGFPRERKRPDFAVAFSPQSASADLARETTWTMIRLPIPLNFGKMP